jgi:hypothetical protein
MLQWWLELGVVGALLGAALVASISCRIGRISSSADRALILGQFVSALVIFDASYGVWQGWWIGLLFLSSAFSLAAMPPSAAAEPPRGVS